MTLYLSCKFDSHILGQNLTLKWSFQTEITILGLKFDPKWDKYAPNMHRVSFDPVFLRVYTRGRDT